MQLIHVLFLACLQGIIVGVARSLLGWGLYLAAFAFRSLLIEYVPAVILQDQDDSR